MESKGTNTPGYLNAMKFVLSAIKGILILTITVGIGIVIKERDKLYPTPPVSTITFEGLQDDFEIQWSRIRHEDGVAWYEDKEGNVVLALPESEEGVVLLSGVNNED